MFAWPAGCAWALQSSLANMHVVPQKSRETFHRELCASRLPTQINNVATPRVIESSQRQEAESSGFPIGSLQIFRLARRG